MSHGKGKFDIITSSEQDWHGLSEVHSGLNLDSPELALRRWDVEAYGTTYINPRTKKQVSADTIIFGDEPEETESGEARKERIAKRKIHCLFTSGAGMPEGTIMPVGSPYAPTYAPLSNARFLEAICKAVDKAGLSKLVRSCGSVKNRQITFISLPLPGREVSKLPGKGEGRISQNYLSALSSFNKLYNFLFGFYSFWTCCANTAAWQDEEGGYRVKHTPGKLPAIDNLGDIVCRVVKLQGEFDNECLKLASIEIDEEAMLAIFASFFTKGDGAMSTRSFNVGHSLITLWKSGAGNEGKNLLDGFSAGTDFYTHSSAGAEAKSNWKQFESSEFGQGAKLKRELLVYLTALEDKPNRDKAIARGQQLLKEYNAAK